MIELNIIPDLEQAPSYDSSRPITHGVVVSMGLLRNGTTTGKATVMVIVETPNGNQVMAETTWALFHSGARALAATPIAAEETTFDA